MSAATAPERRKGSDGTNEVRVGDRWLPEDAPGTMEAWAKAQAESRKAEVRSRATWGATKEPTPRQREVWEAVREHGTQAAAAIALGTQQGTIQSALKGYMKAMGIEGPMPGYATKGERARKAPKPKKPAMQKGGDDIAASPTPKTVRREGSGSARFDVAPTAPSATPWRQPMPDEPSADGRSIIPRSMNGDYSSDLADGAHEVSTERHAEPLADAGADHASDMHPAPRPWRDDVQADSIFVITIDATIPASELATWAPERLSALFRGIAHVEAALNDEDGS